MLFLKYEWQWQWDPNNQFGFFANRNHMATLMVMGSLAGVGSLFIYLKKSNWAAFTITLMSTSIICWAILGYSISRAGLILFISFQMIWFLCVGKKHLNYKLVTSFLILFTLAVILFVLSDTHLEKRLDKLVNPRSSNSKILSDEAKDNYKSILGLRKYIHLDTYNMIKSEPWTGTGLGTYEFIFPFYKKESTFFNDVVSSSSVLHSESNWLDLTSQAGILSAITCLIIILAVIFSTAKRNKKSRSWLLVVSCLLSVICLLTHGFIDVPGQKIGIVMSGILLFGISIKPSHSEDKVLPRYVTFIYQLLAIGIFSLGLIDFNLPLNIQNNVHYDPITGQYIYNSFLGDSLSFRPSSEVSLDDYLKIQHQKSMLEFWKKNLDDMSDYKYKNIEDEIKINEPPAKKIFGSDFVEIRPQGSAELSFGLNSSRTDNPVLPERNRRITTFDFDQKIQMNLTGKIGDLMDLGFNYNTEATDDDGTCFYAEEYYDCNGDPINDSDGDTIILGDPSDSRFRRVQPKANRLLTFNGEHMHTGHSPKLHKNRILINANFTTY